MAARKEALEAELAAAEVTEPEDAEEEVDAGRAIRLFDDKDEDEGGDVEGEGPMSSRGLVLDSDALDSGTEEEDDLHDFIVPAKQCDLSVANSLY